MAKPSAKSLYERVLFMKRFDAPRAVAADTTTCLALMWNYNLSAGLDVFKMLLSTHLKSATSRQAAVPCVYYLTEVRKL